MIGDNYETRRRLVQLQGFSAAERAVAEAFFYNLTGEAVPVQAAPLQAASESTVPLHELRFEPGESVALNTILSLADEVMDQQAARKPQGRKLLKTWIKGLFENPYIGGIRIGADNFHRDQTQVLSYDIIELIFKARDVKIFLNNLKIYLQGTAHAAQLPSEVQTSLEDLNFTSGAFDVLKRALIILATQRKTGVKGKP